MGANVMTKDESAKIQASIDELRFQRDFFADRCANLVQEIAMQIAEIEQYRSILSAKEAEIARILASTETT